MKRKSIRTLLEQQEEVASGQQEPQQASEVLPVQPATPPQPAIDQTAKKPEKVERIKPGYSLRRDLIRECKRIAFEEDRAIYEVIEEAIEMLITSRKKQL